MKTMFLVMTAALGLSALFAADRPPLTDAEFTYASLPYGNRACQVMDVRLPRNSAEPVPAIVFVHGGGWTKGTRRDDPVRSLLGRCDSEGFALIAVEYRLLADAREDGLLPPVRGPMSDLAAAMAFVREHAREWKIDLKRIGLTGGSAGACTSLAIALQDNNRYGIRAVAAAWPQTSLDPREMREWIPNIAYGGQAFGYRDFEDWLAHREESLPWIRRFSPSALLRACDAQRLPVFLFDAYKRLKPGALPEDPTHAGMFVERFMALVGMRGGECSEVPYHRLHEALIKALKRPVEGGFVVGAEQQSGRVVVFDGKRPAAAPFVWEWSPDRDVGIGPADRSFFGCMAECKPSSGDDGPTLLVVGSAGGFAEVSLKTARALTYGVVELSPHSIAKLPGRKTYVIASAMSNCLTVVNAAAAPFDPVRQLKCAYPFYDAHGVEWDERRKCLWALGGTNLVAYAWEAGTLRPLRSYDFRPAGGESGHDLVPDGNGGYLVTTSTSVLKFNPETGAFGLVRREPEVKSISSSDTCGLLIGKTREVWWTDRAIVERDGARYEVGPFPGTKFYKFRWLNMGKNRWQGE